MVVWLSREESSVRPTAGPTIASTSKITASGGNSSSSINDGITPDSSADESNGHFHWWPRKGTAEWVEYAFAVPEQVSESSVYWFDDTGRGECRVPKGWRLMYKDTSAGATGVWRAVKLVGKEPVFGTEKNAFNTVRFEPVTTAALRLEVDLQENWSTGILEWRVK